MIKNLTCIVCPIGCNLEVGMEDGKVISVKGNTCPRGKEYAEKECVSPVRTVTSTVLSDTGKIIPVKTSAPIPKDKIFEVMNLINKTKTHLPTKIGDVIIEDVFGADVVATRNIEE